MLKLTDLDLLHFEQLKKEVQAQYLKEYTPSYDDISKWKGIDIIYFQEDLRKKAKGNISEKSFYTYFKNSPVNKLPRIDMLNLLSIYSGYTSWYEFKKQHLFANELLQEEVLSTELETDHTEEISLEKKINIIEKPQILIENKTEENSILQKNNTEKQEHNTKNNNSTNTQKQVENTEKKSYSKIIWATILLFVVVAVGILIFKDTIFKKTYTYCFSDADRNQNVQSPIEIKVFKQDESPLFYRINPGECFYYQTKDKNLKMQISSTVYENLEVNRNLENAPEQETIELKPDDYKMAVLYFSKKDVSGNVSEQINIKRKQLENRIADNALISQVYDNEIYGIETLDKQKYITLVTTPTTSLKNLSVIEMKKDKKGKIVSIKFKISTNENSK